MARRITSCFDFHQYLANRLDVVSTKTDNIDNLVSFWSFYDPEVIPSVAVSWSSASIISSLSNSWEKLTLDKCGVNSKSL